MSSQQNRNLPPAGISEEAVAHYLQQHPDFFERHGGLVAGLHIPHSTGGAAVSLVERQVAILRQRNARIDRKLQDLVALARANEALSQKVHNLAKALISTTDVTEVLECTERSLGEDFGADRSVAVLFGAAPGKPAHDGSERGFARWSSREDDALKPLATFMQSSGPRCGRITDGQRAFLFGDNDASVRSAALLQLGEKASIGVLAIGSHDPDHFLPTMSTDFLARVGDLVSYAVTTRAT